MDWFERLTGFKEGDYRETQEQFEVSGNRLISKVNHASYLTGQLELAPLGSLRTRSIRSDGNPSTRTRVRSVLGDVRELHRDPSNVGALFQVASQFNLLEMIGPSVTPECGVARYQADRTQGPACAISAGAATIYRNYFVPVGDEIGQTASRQLNALDDLGKQLAKDLQLHPAEPWRMQNGYALPTLTSLTSVQHHIHGLNECQIDTLRQLLKIGLHWDVQATESDDPETQIISQAFCSAMPVAYSGLPHSLWQPMGQIILDAAYEATLCAAVINMKRGRSPVVYLTQLGGGAFGNPDDWIHQAMRRALHIHANAGLDVRIVDYKHASKNTFALIEEFS